MDSLEFWYTSLTTYETRVILLNSYGRVPLACSRTSRVLLVVNTVSQRWPQLLVGDIASAQSGLPQVFQDVTCLQPAAMYQ
ncbi:MAG: hypothetical protein FRX49_11410 [Trebouxia sp. A1-2]|nr:MAG: hypothetical protein FRX49_11410 [Trebouxia sp. A1-2]